MRLLEVYQRFSKVNVTLFPKVLSRLAEFRWSSKLSKSDDLSRIRNIGIVAHIDAGKTTTTERMLYYSGFAPSMGEVHDGDTIMDFMAQERERGITITSAAITFNWKKNRINLIDTPGHVDFTFEVERSLRVLDGAVVILDASAGVEVQTLKVWEQCNRYGVPCIFYFNKMDKPAADVDMCLSSVEKKLKVKPLLLHSPIGKDKSFSGIHDLITLERYIWDKNDVNNNGRTFKTEDMDLKEKDNETLNSLLSLREHLIGNIADLDDTIANKYLSDGIDGVTKGDLQAALRRITLNRSAVPVLCGSSYKNVAVQLLMDAIIRYLPNPTEIRHSFACADKEEMSGLVFKIMHTKNKDPLTFIRLYSGSIKGGQRIHNKNRDSSEKVVKLMVPLADDYHEVPSVSTGNIAVVTGFKEAITGDMLYSSASAATKTESNINEETMPSIQVPDPVFFCTIEPPSIGFQKKLDFALQCLQREDPTFTVEVDETIGQTIVKGMGELHIDIIKERIRSEYNIEAYLGPLQIAYREGIGKAIEYTHVVDKTVAGSKQFVKLTLRLYPSAKEDTKKKVNVVVTKDNNLGKMRSDYLKAVETGVRSALGNGPLLSFPVINVGIDLLWFETKKGISISMISAAASQCVTAGLKSSDCYLLEPIMKLSIVMNKGYAGSVLNDLSQKRSQILNMELRHDVEIIEARTPLSELRGYSSVLRELTSGTCSFTMDFESYQRMDSEQQSRAIYDVTGFLPR